MSSAQWSALQNAVASSAVEGIPLEQTHIEMTQSILNGKLSVQDIFVHCKNGIGRLDYGLFFRLLIPRSFCCVPYKSIALKLNVLYAFCNSLEMTAVKNITLPL